MQEVVVPAHNNILLLTSSGTLPIMASQKFVSGAISLARLQLLRLSMGNWPGMEHWKLSSILQYTLDRRCYLPQDKIYALYGILKRKSPKTAQLTLPAVDYRKSVAQVYTEITWWALMQGDLQMLFLGAIANSERVEVEASGELPSWIPDLARISKLNRAPMSTVTLPGWSSGLQLKERRIIEYPKYDMKQQILELMGHEVDTVVLTSPELPRLSHLLRHDQSRMKKPELLDILKLFMRKLFSFNCATQQQFGKTVQPQQLAYLLGGTTKDSTLQILTMFDQLFRDNRGKWNEAGATEILYRLSSEHHSVGNDPSGISTCDVTAGEAVDHFSYFVSTLVFRSCYTLFATEAGRFGISLGTAIAGDVIAIVDALDQPLIFRANKKGVDHLETWRLVGDASVLGLMSEMEGLHPDLDVFKIV
jgi:hypothetical protein